MAKIKKAKAELADRADGAFDDTMRQPTETEAETSPLAENPADWWVRLSEWTATERNAVWIVLGLGALLFLPFLGTVSLWDPWETHYGEVAREMITRDDFVYPHWESSYFFSKPALPLWLMALGMVVVGAESGAPGEPLGVWTEWGMRMPFVLIAIATMWAVYRMARQLGGRSAGVVTAIVLGSCAQFIFIGKQTMVDMPFVGFLTIGIALFCAAVFDDEEDREANRLEKGLAAGGIALALFPQLALIGRELQDGRALAALGGAILLGAAFMAGILFRSSRRDCYLSGFYVMFALSACSKGLGPVAVLGATGLVYLLFTLDFRIIMRAKVWFGLPLFLLVAAPWYLTVSLFGGHDAEGKTFVARFWLHDNFNRVGAGVHGDRGGLGYYIEQLAYGMFPWVALIPHSVGWASKVNERKVTNNHKRMVIFILAWALGSYAFFTFNQTKFHHYIFPAVPAFAVLVGLWFSHVAKDPARHLSGWVVLPIVVITAVAARDIIDDPQNLVNLFTYKYDRDYPRELNPKLFIVLIVSAGGVAALITYLMGQKGRAMLAFGLMAMTFGAWISHHHFNMLSPHWGQKHLFETFYDERKGDEPIYAYQLNWRGETFYSRNKVLQVKESGANQRIKALVDRPGREFIVLEQSRFHTLKNVLSKDKREKVRILDRSSNKFYLLVVED